MTMPSALQSLLGDFEPAIRDMAGRLQGRELVEAANRHYEFVMAWTPPPRCWAYRTQRSANSRKKPD